MGTSKERSERYARFAELWERAQEAGRQAGEAARPVPMVVQGHANPLNDRSPVTEQWYVPEGVCGFAGVKVRPANSSFALWLRKNVGGYKDYYGGWYVSVHEYGQSYERKIAHARAAADVLREAGIKAYADGRLD